MPWCLRQLPCMLASVAALSAISAGCGDQKPSPSPTAPTTVAPGPVDWTVSGTLVSNPDGQPIALATINVSGGSPVSSNASGQFSIGGAGTQPVVVTVVISATGYLTRGTLILGGSNRTGIVIDLIRDSP